MSIRLQTLGATELRLTNTLLKRNYTTATSMGGAEGQVVGSWLAAWVKLPSPFTGNQNYNIFGADTDEDGLVNEPNQSGLTIGGPTASTAPLRMRWRYGGISANNDGMSQFAAGQSYLVMVGPATNIGTNASPSWVQWIAFCAPGGTPETAVFIQNNTLTSSTVQALLGNIFHAASAQGVRTPVGFELEHVAYVDGDFPWDTANNPTAGITGSGRPHHDAIAALAGSGANPFLDYAGLVAAQNAGTLPYPNLRSNGDAVNPRPGRASVLAWWKLPNLSTLTNEGSGGANPLVITNYNSLSNGLTDGNTNLAPAHWAPAVSPPTINATFDKFISGRGQQAYTVTGTYDAVNTVALQRRWVLAGTSTPAPGRDWADITGISGGNWSFTETVPIGNYDLVVRDKTNTSLSVTSTDWLSGTRVLLHGQSGMALSIRGGPGGGPNGSNNLNVAVASGARGIIFRLDNMYAQGGAGATYAPPGPSTVSLRPGEAPTNCGHGAIRLLNEWNAHNPGHPLMICNMAINTHNMDQWTANAVIPDGDPTWRFMGPATPTPPGAANGNDSGVVSYFAWLLGSRVDLHVVPWLPGLSETTEGRAAYVAAIDTRFFNTPTAPWLNITPWRSHSDTSNNDGASGPTIRNRHIVFTEELGSRGILGPSWMDTINDYNGSGHSAFNTANDTPDNSRPDNVSDGNEVGQGRLGRGLGRLFAWVYDRKIKAQGPRLVNAYFTNGTRNAIVLEFDRVCRTLNGAALYAGQFWVSTNNGSTFVNTGFTAALASDGRSVTLTSTGSAWPATDVRAEVHWRVPFGPLEIPSERDSEAATYGLLYDSQTHRGGTNLTAEVRPGSPLQGTCRSGVGNAGVVVAAKSTERRLLTTERFTGTRAITVRMMASDGVTVLREKTLVINAT